jgi:outer membrane protein OmpA-like peptidoglycan-associated protein
VLALVGAVAGGAAAKGRVVVVDTSVEILEPVRFVGTTAELTPGALRTLDAVARTLAGNPSITKLEVIGFGSDLPGPALHQLALGERRARVIAGELVRRGVAPQRLRFGGEAQPRSGRDPIPVFLILERAP